MLDRRLRGRYARLLAILAIAGAGAGGCSGGGGATHATATSTTPIGSGSVSVALADRGAGLVQAKPCLVCHTTNGSKGAGPTFAGLAGSHVTLADGTTVTADDAYLKRSILDPEAQTVAGFPKGLMTTLVPPNSITTIQADAIVAYLDELVAKHTK